MRIIITGQKGYLVQNLAKRFSKDADCEIMCISMRDDQWRQINFAGYDLIIHTAGIVPGKEKSESDFTTVNTELTKALISKAEADGVDQFIYISTMAVYGICPELGIYSGVIDQESRPNPNNAYGSSKLLAEQALFESEIKVKTVVRVPSIYGEEKVEYFAAHFNMAKRFPIIPNCFDKAKVSLIHIDNLCECIYLAAQAKSEGVICPDDGNLMSVSKIWHILHPRKIYSRFIGLLFEKLLKRNRIVCSLFGAVMYDKSLSLAFDGKYRVVDSENEIKALINSYYR